VRRRIVLTVAVAGLAAVVGWPTAAFAYGPNGVFVGTNSSLAVPCGSTTVSGTGFVPTEPVTLLLEPGSVSLGTAASDATGSFSTSFTLPQGTDPGTYTLFSSGGPLASALTELTVGPGGCHVLSHSTIDPGGSTELHGQGCVPGNQVVLTLDGNVVGQATANSQGMFSASIIPRGYKIGQETVTASCGSRTFGIALAVVSTAAARTPESTTAVFGVFVLLGLVLLWGQFGTSASRRRRHRRA
jgi:hypothetical protein